MDKNPKKYDSTKLSGDEYDQNEEEKETYRRLQLHRENRDGPMCLRYIPIPRHNSELIFSRSNSTCPTPTEFQNLHNQIRTLHHIPLENPIEVMGIGEFRINIINQGYSVRCATARNTSLMPTMEQGVFQPLLQEGPGHLFYDTIITLLENAIADRVKISGENPIPSQFDIHIHFYFNRSPRISPVFGFHQDATGLTSEVDYVSLTYILPPETRVAGPYVAAMIDLIDQPIQPFVVTAGHGTRILFNNAGIHATPTNVHLPGIYQLPRYTRVPHISVSARRSDDNTFQEEYFPNIEIQTIPPRDVQYSPRELRHTLDQTTTITRSMVRTWHINPSDTIGIRDDGEFSQVFVTIFNTTIQGIVNQQSHLIEMQDPELYNMITNFIQTNPGGHLTGGKKNKCLTYKTFDKIVTSGKPFDIYVSKNKIKARGKSRRRHRRKSRRTRRTRRR